MLNLSMISLGLGVYLLFLTFGPEEVRVSILGRLNINRVRKRYFSVVGLPLRTVNKHLLKIFKLEGTLQDKLQFIDSQLLAADFLFLKEILAGGVGLGVWYLSKSFLNINTTHIIISVVVVFFLPDLWLIRKVKALKFEILKSLPETIDLLGLCIEAGLDFVSGVRWILEKAKSNPFLNNLRIVVNEIIVGKSKQDALSSMGKRTNMIEVRSFSNTLIQAERMGTPIREAFDIISEDTRDRRFQIGEKQALRAPVLIIFPLMLILAIVVIIVAGPIFIRFMTEGFLKM